MTIWAPWYLIILLSGQGKAVEVVPMMTAQTCEEAKRRVETVLGYVGAATCVASGSK